MVAAAPAAAPGAGVGISPATVHRALAASYTCIDCHKGLAHKLPHGA
jgi:nitrate/TMAO reductase-like tetraheme cytochrome c subunit